jgi:GTP pyrophosphokinase
MDVQSMIKACEERVKALKAGDASLVGDTLDNLAPEAERMGLYVLQHEMQDLAIKVGFPDDYRQIKSLLTESEVMCEIVFKTFTLPIKAMLDAIGLEYELEYRMKSVYSIWRKMRNDHKTFDDVYDLFASRIVYKPMPLPETQPLGDVNPKTEPFMDAEILTCWKIYNIILSLYRIHPDRIKDWVTHPKPSGYQALQLTVMGPDCNWIELQIRSERMNYEAEHGCAAHWKYKEETNNL